MAPSVCARNFEMPSEPCSASPPGAFQTLSWPNVQDGALVEARYLVKLSLVPELSARCTVVIFVDGRLAPELSAAISGSFHLVTLPAKMSASVVPDSCRLLTPLTL